MDRTRVQAVTGRLGANKPLVRKENSTDGGCPRFHIQSRSHPLRRELPQRLGGASGLLGPPRIGHWPPRRPSKRPVPGPHPPKDISPGRHLPWPGGAPAAGKGEEIRCFFSFFACVFLCAATACVMEPTKQHRDAGTSTRAGSPHGVFGRPGLRYMWRSQRQRQNRRAGCLIIGSCNMLPRVRTQDIYYLLQAWLSPPGCQPPSPRNHRRPVTAAVTVTCRTPGKLTKEATQAAVQADDQRKRMTEPARAAAGDRACPCSATHQN